MQSKHTCLYEIYILTPSKINKTFKQYLPINPLLETSVETYVEIIKTDKVRYEFV